MWRIAAILAAIAAFVYIAVVGVQWLQPRVEDDILNRVNAALAEQGMLWADVTVSGRQVVLGGHAPDDANRAEALNVASRVFGVASVSDATIVGNLSSTTPLKALKAKTPAAYQLTIEKAENHLLLHGQVASAQDAQVIRRIVSTHFPDMQVQDDLQVVPDAPAGWRSAVGVVLMNMTNLEKAEVTISNTEVMLQGEVLDQKYSDQLQNAIKQALPKGYKAGFAVDVVSPSTLAQEEAQDISASTVSGTSTVSATVSASSVTAPALASVPTPTAEVVTASTTEVTSPTVAEPSFISSLWDRLEGVSASVVDVSESALQASSTLVSNTLASSTTVIHRLHGKKAHNKPVTKAPVSPTTVVATSVSTSSVAMAPSSTLVSAEATPAATATDCHGLKRVASAVIYFGFDKAGLPAKGRPVIRRVATTLKACPAQHVTVHGYTDMTGSTLYNKWLSEQRAESGVRALRRQGVAASQLSAVGHGEVKHVAHATHAVRSLNRRIEFHPDSLHVEAGKTAHKAKHAKASAATVSDTMAPAAGTAESGWWNSLFGANGTSGTAPVSNTAQ